LTRAIELYEQALVIDLEIGDLGGEGADLNNLGLAYAALGDVRRAIELYEHGLRIFREIGRREAEALRAWNQQLSNALVPGALPVGQVAEFQHHLSVLAATCRNVASQGSAHARVDELRRMYRAAHADFQVVESNIRRLECGRA
jgi:tetratricopeptide (TPR) repeat protein